MIGIHIHSLEFENHEEELRYFVDHRMDQIRLRPEIALPLECPETNRYGFPAKDE